MKYLMILVVMLYKVDIAFAENDSIELHKLEAYLQKAAKLNVFMLQSLPRPVIHDQASPVNPSPLSCDIKLQKQREKVALDYNCDPIKTLKTETLLMTAN